MIDRIVCFLRTDWITRWPIPISGHQFFEVYSSKGCQVLMCDYCDKIQTGFYFDPRQVIESIKVKARERGDLV